MVSLYRTINNIRRGGWSYFWRNMQYIGDAKYGAFKGQDQFGNRYYENQNPEEEVPGRQRWVDFAKHDYDASQVPPEWHAWLSHIRGPPPQEDKIVQNLTPPWKGQWPGNVTGTRGAFRTYNTAKPKINAWEPKVASRG